MNMSLFAAGAAITLFAAAWCLLWLMRKDTLNRGKLTQSNEDMKGALDDIHAANIVRDGIKSDVNKRISVRERFTRPE